MGAVDLAGALADPEHVGGAVVPVVGEGVLAGEGFLVAEDQRLVAREEVDLVERWQGLGVDAAGLHEAQGAVDVVCQALVALTLAAGCHELLVPLVDAGQVGEAALHERPEQVQGRRRLVVRLQQALGVGHPRRLGGGDVVDDVTAERRQVEIADALRVGRARLGELPGDASHLHDRDAGGVAEHDGHLEDDLERVADAVGGERVERLGAVARLEQERATVGDLAEGLGEVAGLAGEHERRERGQLLEHRVERCVVGPRRLLGRGAIAPG